MSSQFRQGLLATTLLLGVAAGAGPAGAQEAAETADTTEAAEESEIVVTGSLIRNPNLERSSPVNVTGEGEIELLQINNVEELLRDLPGLSPSIGSSVNNGNAGASFVDLRGLGNNRNLVLLDGTRVTPSNFVGRVDLNTIPVALVERVEVLTGGATTTYGADAVTGVVNFITRDDFEGFELQISKSITGEGDGGTFRADATFGANTNDGRGNVAIGIGWQEAEPVYQGDRAISMEAIDSFTGASGGSSTTVPSVFSVPGLGNRQITPATGALDPIYAVFNFAPYNIFQTPFERFNLFGTATYEITDNVEAYARAMTSKTNVQTIVAPSGLFGVTVSIPVSNPYLPAAARTAFCLRNDFDPNTPGVQTLTDAQCAAAAVATDPNDPNYREFTTNLRRRTTEVGPRISDYTTNLFDYKVGLRGTIGEAIEWDVFGAYGESENRQTLQNYVSVTRMRQALRATNTTECLGSIAQTAGCVPVNIFGPDGSISPEAADFLRVESYSLNKTSLAQFRGTVSGETGLEAPWAEEAINFALGVEYREYTAVQTSDLLARTPGELGGAGGAQAEVDGGYNVYELFGEIVAPLVQDQGWTKDLTVEAGARYSTYEKDATGASGYEAWTYKGGLSWSPVDPLTFRSNYSRAVRAPNIGELFFPLNTGLTNLALDPCQGIYPGDPDPIANPNLTNQDFVNICLAQGAPQSEIDNGISAPTAGQANATTIGDITLTPETADTMTIGLIFQPDFLPGSFHATLDYYKIEVKDAISVITPGDAIALCFGAPNSSGVYTEVTAASASSAACTVIGRDPSTGELNSDPATTRGLFLAFTNLGELRTDGFDLNANWINDLGFAELTLDFTANYTMSAKFKAQPISFDRECVGYYSINCSTTGSLIPEYTWTQRTTLSFSAFDLSLLWRHISPFEQEPEDILRGNGPGYQGPLPGSGEVVDFQHIDAYDYFDLTGRYEVNDNLTVTASVKNLLDKEPPNVGSSMGSTTYNSGNTYPSTYDALGRAFAIQIRYRN